MRVFMLVLIIMFVFSPAGVIAAPAGETTLEGFTDPLAFEDAQTYVNQLDNTVKGVVPHFDFKDTVKKLVKGEQDWKPADILNNIVSLLFKEVVANFALLGQLVVLAVICAVLQNLVCSFEKGTTGQLAYSVTYLVLITLAIGSFSLAVNTGRDVVDAMVTFMQALLPVLLTLLVAVGGLASAAIFSPVVLGTLGIFGSLIKNIILPLFFFVAILGVVSNLTDRFKVTNLADLLKTIAMGLMGVFTTIFLGVLAIQGVAGAVSDSVTYRTARFTVKTFVPMVGGMLSDAMDAVISSSLLIKNALGIAGIGVIGAIMIVPLLKIVTLAFTYKLAGSLIQPVADGQMVDCLNSLGNSLFLVFAAVATVGLLFFFTITIVVGIGNITVMLR